MYAIFVNYHIDMLRKLDLYTPLPLRGVQYSQYIYICIIPCLLSVPMMPVISMSGVCGGDQRLSSAMVHRVSFCDRPI